MKNRHIRPGILLTIILSFGVSAFAGTPWSKGGLKEESKELSEAEKIVSRANQELELAIQFKKKTMAKTAILCSGFAGLLRRPTDLSMMDEIKNPRSPMLFSILLQPELVSGISEALEPVLTELYDTYPRAAILTQMDDFLDVSRLELAKLYFAQSMAQRFLDDKDEYHLERSNILAQQLREHSDLGNFMPIALKFVELLQKNQDLVFERLMAMKLSVGIVADIINGFSDLKNEDESKED